MHPSLTASVGTIARRIREGDWSPVDVVEAHIKRIEQVNPQLHAVVTPMYESARQQAYAAQERLQQGDTDDLPPLFGVPVTVKDSWLVKGVRATGGSWYLRDNIAQEDSPGVARLRDAGAIILGKTNCPDMCWLGETQNLLFGRTNNPHDPRYTAGGSSGGEGAIIAAGGSPLGVGSDIAGSVRIPAAVNGCVALKPTAGRVPSTGHLPEPPQTIDGWNTMGPMARHVDDVALGLRVLANDDVRDYRDIDITGRRCTVYIENGMTHVRFAVKKDIEKAALALHDAGMTVQRDDDIPLLEAAYAYVGLFDRYARHGFTTALGGGEPYNLLEEIWWHLRGRGRISKNVLWFNFYMGIAGKVMRAQGFGTMQRLESIRQRVLDHIGEDGVLLLPLLTTRVPPHNWSRHTFVQPPYTFLFNALGFPAVVLPIGYDDRGLPQSVQIVAAPGQDELVLAVAAQLEKQFGGWRMAAL